MPTQKAVATPVRTEQTRVVAPTAKKSPPPLPPTSTTPTKSPDPKKVKLEMAMPQPLSVLTARTLELGESAEETPVKNLITPQDVLGLKIHAIPFIT